MKKTVYNMTSEHSFERPSLARHMHRVAMVHFGLPQNCDVHRGDLVQSSFDKSYHIRDIPPMGPADKFHAAG